MRQKLAETENVLQNTTYFVNFSMHCKTKLVYFQEYPYAFSEKADTEQTEEKRRIAILPSFFV